MPRYCAIVPAAGSGSRFAASSGSGFGAGVPKQYLPIAGRPLVFHSLYTLTRHPAIERVVVVLAPDDAQWGEHDWSALGHKLEVVGRGGASRAASVLAGLAACETFLDDDDWVLVHDAARPCLAASDLDTLIATLAEDPVGGLLAVPLADTLKRADADGRVAATPSREGLWQAQTPQMFRAGLLREALAGQPGVTDEAGAIEACGLRPRLVAAAAANFKVTYPADLELARLIIEARPRGRQ